MAEFLWTFGLEEILKRVVKIATEQIGLAWGMEKELSKLSKWLLKAEAILGDINRKKLHHDSVRMWVEDLQRIVYEADDLLDELAYEDLRQKVEMRKAKKVRNFISPSHNPFLFRAKMAKQMKGITQTLYKHYCEASPLGLIGRESTETDQIVLKQIRETTSNLNFEVVGREIEVSDIVKLVIYSSNEHHMSIIPIVGMGGLGKTTLAKMIFNHELIKGHFDKTIWVCVSEPFIIINILEGIFQSLTNTSSGLNYKEALLQRLQKEMHGKNYFLVLDDVWNEERGLWDELKDCLKEIAKKSGNSIIVTTRNVDIATIIQTVPSHHLRKLSDGQCWSLFKKSANANGLLMNPKLEIIREDLVKKIGGVPLVAKVLGGTVKFEGDYEEWVAKVESIVRNIAPDNKDFVLSVLQLSVDYLPHFSLKQCFAYCSNFPKDCEMSKENIIQMWIAEGFIQPQEGENVMLEDIGEGYFNFLLSRSLFQDVFKDMDGTITHFKMHDLLHDVACVISNRQKLESDASNRSGKTVRKSRTLICSDNLIDNKLMDYVCLRVLEVNSSYVQNLPDSIGMLKHLRYLDIMSCTIRKLPESITMLYNLQTLKLGTTVDLPRNLRKLVSLRHLQFLYIYTLQMPLHMSQLVHLQTLPAFVVGFEKGCKIEELGPLKNLKGSLQLSNLKRVRHKEEAMAAKLFEKKNLRELIFDWNSSSEEEDSSHNDLEVLEGLQPHKNLQSLSIDHFAGQAIPNGIFVEDLIVILLQECNNCEMLPMLGQLPNLEELQISSMGSVRSIGAEFYGNDSNQRVFFPKLKKLSFRLMQRLEQWEEVLNGIAFPRLESLSMVYCPKLVSIPDHFVSLRALRILRCEELAKLPNVLGSCNSIEYLNISDCPNLTLNVQNMHNLKEMEIIGCIQDYDFSPLVRQSSITHLSLIDSFSSAIQLPQQLEHLTTLKALSIKSFNVIEALPEWLGNLTSLERLSLLFCENLKQLPSKEAMLCLTKLNHLDVRGCPLLLLGQGDSEWAKLSYLPINCANKFETSRDEEHAIATT